MTHPDMVGLERELKAGNWKDHEKGEKFNDWFIVGLLIGIFLGGMIFTLMFSIGGFC